MVRAEQGGRQPWFLSKYRNLSDTMFPFPSFADNRIAISSRNFLVSPKKYIQKHMASVLYCVLTKRSR